MFNDRIGDYFEGVAAKYLSAVDADKRRSNQHEIGGLPAAGFKQWLGEPRDKPHYFRARQVYIRDYDEAPLICDSEVSWYDSRRNSESRLPEYRLYYPDSPVTEQIAPGDFLLVAKLRDDSLLMVFTPAGGSVESQLRAIFGLDNIQERFSPGVIGAIEFLLPLRLMLEELGVDIASFTRDDDAWLGSLLEKFGAEGFPSTTLFSEFARDSIRTDVNPIGDPDEALMAWMNQEEKLFRIYERHLLKIKLNEGFGQDDNVTEFLKFSLSVQNRRKSRAGHAFENHLDALFRAHGLKFEQGKGRENFTENRSKPDFIFPSFSAYRNSNFPAEKLTMLGAKTTCKDRWRQVLSEAIRVKTKYLVTLEPAISEHQTNEMNSHNLFLVIPTPLHVTYTINQRKHLIGVQQFILRARLLQS
ncbi:restriction endonuclease [Herbaspirillum sp. LeCh32-8]|uniref:type II restriction endonuclease n=1 Tax=Herbaspirillum sp. LeCh32-8 TaxID=2821356 RepID=UPI001AE1249D|nr:type II restriction endonuclease [Herbaspirillum sp. LeCh32-8]MBP0598991.1 restriction endonuclease [Herbaspirillum sp. LeCh32-8]